MERTKITIVVNGNKEPAYLKHDSAKGIIKFSMSNGFRKTYESDDLYLCLAKIREEHPDIIFMCKGAKRTVTPSRMSSQMSGGYMAYELTLGKQATFDDLVKIFDYEEHDISKNPEDQILYYKQWIHSLTSKTSNENT